MVFCSGCGKKLPPYPVRFCPECGNSITNTISGLSNSRSEQIEYRRQAQKIEGNNIQVQISKYAEYLVYEGEDADVLVRELKGGVYKVRIREYIDKDEFEENTYFVSKSTLNEIFRL